MMRMVSIIAVSVSISLGGCATGYNRQANRALAGTAVGAAAGALAGGLTGAGALQGAALGGIAGAAVGTMVKGPLLKGRQYYRDTNGACYYIGRNGDAIYDQRVRC